jgi:DNA-binding IclR family transcriptional regulator
VQREWLDDIETHHPHRAMAARGPCERIERTTTIGLNMSGRAKGGDGRGQIMEASVVVPAVRRAAEIMDAIMERQGDPISLTDLARLLRIPKSSTLNICTEMTESRLLRRVDGLYTLGPKLAVLGAVYLSSVDVVRDFQNLSADCNPEIQETLKLSVLGDNGQIVFLARHDAARPAALTLDVRVQQPGHCTAAGKAMLACLTTEEFDQWLAGRKELVRLTKHSIGSLTAMRKELRRVRSLPYATEDGECIDGIFCVGVAVRNSIDNTLYGLSFAMLKQWATPEHIDFLGTELRRIGRELSILLDGGAQLTSETSQVS